jgi:hypothetical protein
VNLRGFDPEHPPADPSAVLEAFLRQLGVAAQQIPASRGERAAMYRDRLRDRSALVLLDNAASDDQVQDLIPASPRCLVLITSRRSLAGLDGATPHRLTPSPRKSPSACSPGSPGAIASPPNPKRPARSWNTAIASHSPSP